MLRFLVVAALVITLLASAGFAEDVLPPERAYQAKLAKAQSDYALAAKKALEELKAELEKLKVDATKAGDLDKALAIRTKVEAIGDGPAKPIPATKGFTGRLQFQYSNGLSREYEFTKDGSLIFVKGIGGKPLDTELPGHRAKVYWIKAGDNTVGFIDWGHVGQFERVTFTKEGLIVSTHFTAQGVLTAEGKAVK
ncbi:hypothetical protein ETAA8_45730 [Anatilimnocola aggregata]|uniref:Uncharacterized protein n=1 Tax=Anatilimnocola aggregata TaxID=2528021 RepID=A0A517YGW4_9BACT|nr:hypothetical protein [Anatilimnocola aggregata]QDU29463.1 hypothetical protein ETAA8_45730 [Anatilimnocola aggregata]